MSTDEQLTVKGSPRIARKDGQRRRPTAERAHRVLRWLICCATDHFSSSFQHLCHWCHCCNEFICIL